MTARIARQKILLINIHYSLKSIHFIVIIASESTEISIATIQTSKNILLLSLEEDGSM